MRVVNLVLSIEAPDLDELSSWSAFESLAVQMTKELAGLALAQALDELQERLVDSVCGPKWAPLRGLPAPFACPGLWCRGGLRSQGSADATETVRHLRRAGRGSAVACRVPGVREGVRAAAGDAGPSATTSHRSPEPRPRRAGVADVVRSLGAGRRVVERPAGDERRRPSGDGRHRRHHRSGRTARPCGRPRRRRDPRRHRRARWAVAARG